MIDLSPIAPEVMMGWGKLSEWAAPADSGGLAELAERFPDAVPESWPEKSLDGLIAVFPF